MAKAIAEGISADVRELITQTTKYKTDSERFASLEKGIVATLRKSDTMYFLNTKDVKKAVWAMAEKFTFQGFFEHAAYLKVLHDRYIDKNLSESDLTPRLNVVKFLLCMSQRPTEYFWKEPDKFQFIQAPRDRDEVVDWEAYLNEGIERWSPVKDESFQESSDSEEDSNSETLVDCGGITSRRVISELRQVEEYDFQRVRNDLLENIQNSWYNTAVICMKPPSEWFDANTAILWQQHLQDQTRNLIIVDPITVISEYKVMREILWQFWGVHNSTAFRLHLDKLMPKSNVTISSACAMSFEEFMGVFLPYIEVLDDLRQFWASLEGPEVAETYKSYGCATKTITKFVFEELIVIEKEMREQETTMTLLKLAEKLEIIFEPVLALKKIHQEVVLGDFQNVSTVESSLTLLTSLRRSLQFPSSKLEQDIRLTLYLECLYYYFTIINAWLVKNDLYDHTEEFIILNKNDDNLQLQMNFVLRENIEKFCQEDGIIRIISDQVLQIGRNIHLLRLLGKNDVFARGSETIHEEFIRRILEEISKYYEHEIPDNDKIEVPELRKIASTFDTNEMGDWTNFVDLSDGFLTKAFEDFYAERIGSNSSESLFDRIGKVTTNLFPLQDLPEKTFTRVLKERFTVSGLMVKNLLIENYHLDRQFEFLNDVFLFWNDQISPFYRRLFQKMNIANSNWGNSLWLTSHLQDILMDSHPNFYEECSVKVDDQWRQCRDSLEACALITVEYRIKWPLNILITERHVAMYQEIFRFILKIKWALYTINRLFFTDLEPKGRSQDRRRASPSTTKRLKYLRFNTINILNSVQHYLFGFVFARRRIRFDIDFEKSNDLKSLIASHEDFLGSVHGVVVEIRDRTLDGCGFGTLLRCVKMLKVMWNRVEYATMENLDNCQQIYKHSSAVVEGILNPVLVL